MFKNHINLQWSKVKFLNNIINNNNPININLLIKLFLNNPNKHHLPKLYPNKFHHK